MSIAFRRLPLLLGALLALACKDPKPTTGTLVVNIAGLPAAAAAEVRVTGPADFNEPLTASQTFERLAPGDYVVTINSVTHSNGLFTSAVSQTIHTVMAGATETSDVLYALTGGSIDLTITGLPTGSGPAVQLKGPSNFSRIVLTSGIQAGLPAGQYTIQSDSFAGADGHRYGTSAYLQNVTVAASLTSVPASVTYGIVSGTLTINVTGLASPQVPPPVRITGPGNFDRATSITTEYRGLVGGTYTITAAESGSCPTRYSASQPTQTVDVASGAQHTGTVAYSALSTDPASINLSIDGAHAIQVTQDFDGNVPMIAGKRALLRVFGVANQCNSVLPKVRVTLSNGAVYDNLVLGAGETSVRLEPEQGFLAASWNVEIPAAAVQPGLTYVAEIDPANEVAEANESDNRFPATGAQTINVRSMSPTGLRVIPVTISQTSQTGNVSAANVEQFLDMSRRMHPIFAYDVDIREPFTSARAPFQSNDQNGTWVGVLQDINALRAADASQRYYYGVVKVSYNSGVAGIGFIGQKASIGWDYLPSGSSVMAHELGHNFGRFHSPCGNPAGPDPGYPHPGGLIGVYGFDFTDSSVKDPQLFTDIMGYCNNQWISNYTYSEMLTFLTHPNRGPTLPMVASMQEEQSILVWGRIVSGEPVLEPAFEVSTRPQMPAPGAHRLSLMGANGQQLASVSFAADKVAERDDAEIFAFTIPKSMLKGQPLASLRLVTRGGRTATNVQSVDVAAEAEMTMQRVGPRSMRLRWNAQRFPVVMVRDPRTREILSFARGGDMTIVTDRDELEMNYSNRVRSIRQLERLR